MASICGHWIYLISGTEIRPNISIRNLLGNTNRNKENRGYISDSCDFRYFREASATCILKMSKFSINPVCQRMKA